MKTIRRRSLFDVFRTRQTEDSAGGERGSSATTANDSMSAGGFDVEAFYRRRAERGEVTTDRLPAFELRAGPKAVETSKVGVERAPRETAPIVPKTEIG